MAHVGTKYSKTATLSGIKRGIVSDLRAAVEAGILPAGEYTVHAVRGRWSLCDPEVTVTIDDLAFAVTNPDKLAAVRRGDNTYHGYRLSDEASTVEARVADIVGAYNYRSPHGDVGFHSRINFPAEHREYTAAAEAWRILRGGRHLHPVA